MNDLHDNNLDNTVSQHTPEMMRPLSVILTCLGFFLIGNLVTGGITMGLSKIYGFDFNQMLAGLNENSPLDTRNFVRFVLFLNHLCGFILPALLTSILVYKNLSVNYLKLDKLPNIKTVGLAFLLLMVSVPLVQYSALVNKLIPLPQWMKGLEQDTEKMLSAILTKEYWYEMGVNLLLIGVVPALGEELVFRGILQQQLGRIFKNEHVMVWLSAAIFSAIHFQFEGFIPRMILGALLGYAFVWTRNLWVPMIVHLLNNGLQIIVLYAANIKPSEMEKMGGEDKMTWWMALISLGFVLYVADLMRKNEKPQALIVNN
jgi:uncharacterized protein